MPTPAREAITSEFLIVGEGEGDEAFLKYLCQVRQITGFQFDHADGKDKFGLFLTGLRGRTGIATLKALLIVGDNDESPDANFKNIQRQIGKAKLPQPNNPLSRATRGDAPYSLAVLMLPYPRIGTNSHGCLETLLLPAAERNLQAQTLCLNPYCACVLGCTPQWDQTSRDKMRLRCLLSSAHPRDPNLGLRYALNPDLNLIPLNDDIFSDVADLLIHFPEWMRATQHSNWSDWRAANP